MAGDRVARCAALLAELRRGGPQIPYLPADVRPRDEREAYLAQFALHERLSQAGQGPRAGWKIGCTTKVMQDFLGIPSPCAGGMFVAGIQPSPAGYDFAALRKPGVECEIAVRLANDVPVAEQPFDRGSIAPHVGTVMAAMEVVEERFVDFRAEAVDAASLIADDFFHVGAVLGPEVAPGAVADLADLTGLTRIDGNVVGRGSGADVMGHPYAALAWLANHLGSFGIALQAGDVVLTGSVVATEYPPGPAEAITEIGGLGQAICRFRGMR